jgi:hypothetical protein
MVGRQGLSTTGFWTTFTAHWDGSAWSAVDSPNKPGSVDNWLNDLSVRTDGDIWAVGAWTDAGSAHGMIQHWDGADWSIVGAPSSFELQGVAAVTASDAWAAGLTAASTFEIQRWNGQQWKRKNGVLGSDARATSMSAAASDDVWAMGVSVEGPQIVPLAQHWDGSGWTQVAAEYPTAYSLSVEDVSVTSAGDRAYAVGYSYKDLGSPARTLALEWC